MPDQESQEQQYRLDPTEMDQEEQFGEDFIREALGLTESATSTKEETPSGEDSVETSEPVEKKEKEAPQEESYLEDEDGVEYDPARALPERPVIKEKVSEEEDATESIAERQSPEFRAMIEERKQLRRLLSEREAELTAYRRQREESELAEEEFIGAGEDLDEVLTNPKAMNSLLNKVYRKGILSGKEHVFKSFDEQLDKKVRVHIDRRARAERFFESNPELSTPKVREYVFLVGQELAEQHPEWDIDTFYAHLGPETKSRLGLAAAQVGGKAKPVSKGAPGGMNRAGGTRPPSKRQISTLADEVAENLGL